jgi:ComF family protein
VDLVAPVPLHWRRRAWRGFNQATALAQEAVRAMGRPLTARGLLRVRPTPHQTRLPPARRVENVRGAFAVRGRASAVKGKRVLLVDDVLTSGATIGECARVLRRAGAAAVYAAVVAVAGPDEPGPW